MIEACITHVSGGLQCNSLRIDQRLVNIELGDSCIPELQILTLEKRVLSSI